MITFKINGTKHPIPTSWYDVTFAQYIAIQSCDNTISAYISLFTGIPVETLEKAELHNLEKISIALSFLTLVPQYEAGPTKMVGPYVLPQDVSIQSLGQFEDLRGLLGKLPKDLSSLENRLLISDLYLEACAIYVQKIKDGSYDYLKVPQVKEELKQYSSTEIIQTGSFFLFKPLNLSRNTTIHSPSIRQRLKKLIQGFPGYQKTLDSLQRSLGSPVK
jgi:hypothetical protein